MSGANLVDMKELEEGEQEDLLTVSALRTPLSALRSPLSSLLTPGRGGHQHLILLQVTWRACSLFFSTARPIAPSFLPPSATPRTTTIIPSNPIVEFASCLQSLGERALLERVGF